jgi:hypothetical protein
MFRRGFDTFELKRILKRSEAEVLQLLNTQRSLSLGLPNPYQASEAARPSLEGIRGKEQDEPEPTRKTNVATYETTKW